MEPAGTVKRISQFDPVGAPEVAEHHYRHVHTRFVRGMFRDRVPGVRRYVANRVEAQYDLAGTFEQRPDAWRFVIAESRPTPTAVDGATDGADWLPEQDQELIWQDHLNCIRNIRSHEVTEQVLMRRPSRTPSSTKYLVVLESRRDGADAARWYREEHLPVLTGLVRQAFGARLVISNAVDRQLRVGPVAEEGQRYIGGYLSRTPRVAVEELYFDNAEWAGEFFAGKRVHALYHRSPVLAAAAYRVHEEIGIDRDTGWQD